MMRGVQVGGVPGGLAGPGGRSPRQVGGPGGRSLDLGGVPPNSLGVPPPDCEYPGAPAQILPGVPPSAAKHASGGGAGGAGGLGGRSPSQADGPGGRLLCWGGVPPNSLGGTLPDFECPGPCCKFCQRSPPLLRGVQCERALVGLVARVGAHPGRRWVIPGPPTRMGNARGILKESCTRFPSEERGGCLSVQVA